MVPYFLLLILALLAMVINKYDTFKFVSTLLVIVLILLVGLRDITVGEDTENYINGYLYGMGERMEPFFQFFSTFCKKYSFHVNAYLTTIAALTIYPLWRFVRKESVNPGYSLLVYLTYSILFYFQTFNTVRACLAITLIFWGCFYLSHHKSKSALLCFAVVPTIHYSSILILLIISFVYFIHRFSYKFVVCSIALSIVLGFAVDYLISEYLLLLGLVVSQLSGDVVVSNYAQLLTESSEASMGVIGMLSNMLPFSLFAILMHSRANSQNLYYKLYVSGIIVANIFISTPLFYRVSMFFQLFIVILYPNAYYASSKQKKYILGGLTSFMVVWYITKLLRATEDSFCGAFPYMSCL